MKNSTYFISITLFLIYASYTSWNSIINSRFFIIFISLLFLFLSCITTRIEKERDELKFADHAKDIKVGEGVA